MIKPRTFAWLLAITTLSALAAVYGQITTSFDAAGVARTWLTICMGGLGIASVILFPTFSNKRKTLLAILLPGLIVRSLVAQSAPSDDIHRYLWEGKLLNAGEDPYAVLADDTSRTPYHDYHWERMNHRDKPTAYPPLAMLSFSWINKLGYSPTSYKVIFTLLDLALIACVLSLLRHYGKPEKWASFYALSPISFLAFSAEAHFDILMVLSLIGGVLAYSKQRWIVAGIALALAIQFKLMVAIAIPFYLWRSPWKMWITFAATLILPLLPFVSQLESMISALLLFGAKGSFNGPIYQFLQYILPEVDSADTHREIVNRLIASGFALTWLIIAYQFLTRRLTALNASIAALSAFLIFSPIIHFWYLAWIFPFIALSPRASWLSLSITVGLYFLVWQQLSLNQTWEMPVYARWLFWLPFLIIALWQAFGKKRLLDTSVRHIQSARTNLSIVIPTKNPGTGLQTALHSIQSQTIPVAEIIIVDAHSSDGSLDAIEAGSKLQIIKSPAGRGLQIQTGVEAAKSDWVLILHADAQLQDTTLEQLQKHIATNPSLVGGCLGQRFDSQSFELLFIETLNELRGLFARTSFGDQAQFLHRQTALDHDVLTDQPLMEDVEISDRLRPLGQVSYLGNEVTVSAEKWRKHPFWKRFRLIVQYYFRYRLMLWKSTEERKTLATKLVQEYYSASNS
jgi:hypothetical protein